MPGVNDNLPASESRQTKTFPWGTAALCLATLGCGIAQHFDSTGRIAEVLGFHFSRFGRPFAFSSERPLPAAIQLVTHVFPHGGWWHLLPNVTALFVFGAMAEKRLGAWRLLLLYFVSGAMGVICHSLVPPLPSAPVAGASLAISGLLGAFLALACTEGVRSKLYRRLLVSIELVSVAGMVAWVCLRTVPPHPDRVTSLLYHLLPMTVMWSLVRGYLAVSGVVTNAAKKAANPSVGSGGV